MAVRATVVGTPVRSVLRLGEWEMGGRDECGEKGNGWWQWCTIME
jgi:hypothetical protein